MSESPIRILQITDIHLFADKNRELLGVNTQQSFEALIDLIKKDNPSPQLILLTGDLSQDSSEEAYARLADSVSEFNTVVYCIPGNHDNSDAMQKVYPRGMISLQKQIVLDGWQLILLDSHLSNRVEGHLAESELKFMEHCLTQYPKHRAIIVFHHQPIPVGSVWLDRLGINNAKEFWDLLTQYPQVQTIIFGHVHQQHEGVKNNIQYFSTPSTCIQFKRNSDKFALEELGPAYRIIDLLPTGEIKTSIHFVSHYVGRFEPNATGY